jgi:hypothetical protein
MKKIDLEKILAAAKNSMIYGKRRPHCFHARVAGRGYVNDGSIEFDRADYLAQLARAIDSEISNLGYAIDYAEPGYTKPARGILFADWNKFPKRFDSLLEKLGFAVEWNDEWTICDCQKAYRTSADSFCWEPSFKTVDGEEMCLDCAKTLEPEPEEPEETTDEN